MGYFTVLSNSGYIASKRRVIHKC